MPPPAVPGLIVTYSRIVLSATDDERRFLAVIFEVLRLEPDRGEREDPRPLADRRMAVDHDMGAQHHPGPERHMLADDAIGPDHDVAGEVRARRDDGGRMDVGHLLPVYWSRIIAAYTASATRLSPTLALPSNFHTLPRWRCLTT